MTTYRVSVTPSGEEIKHPKGSPEWYAELSARNRVKLEAEKAEKDAGHKAFRDNAKFKKGATVTLSDGRTGTVHSISKSHDDTEYVYRVIVEEDGHLVGHRIYEKDLN